MEILHEEVASAVQHPKSYALATLPRSITRDDVSRFLAIIDRKTNVGRRDYAILLLLVTYGLRAREVAAMALDDFDWRRERLRVSARTLVVRRTKFGKDRLVPFRSSARTRARGVPRNEAPEPDAAQRLGLPRRARCCRRHQLHAQGLRPPMP